MYVTREADYAVRCVLHLAGQPEKRAAVGEIAKPTLIPKSFLAKILQRLVKAGIVRSIRGVGGGFQLTREPREITLLDVIEAVQGQTAANACAVDKRVCALSGTCAVHPIWVQVRQEIEGKLREQNFEKLAAVGGKLRGPRADPR